MRRGIFCVFALLIATATRLPATEIVDYHWLGSNGNYWGTPYNWREQSAPNDVSSARAIFGSGVTNTYIVFGEVSAYGLVFDNVTAPFYFAGSDYGLQIGAGGIDYRSTSGTHSIIDDEVKLFGNQTWDIALGGSLTIDGPITDSYEGTAGEATINKTGLGTLKLTSPYSSDWSGGLTLSAGRVEIYAAYDTTNKALGTGTLTFDGGTLVSESLYGDDEVVLKNHIHSTGTIAMENHTNVRLASADWGGGGISLSTDTTINSRGSTLFIDGNIDEDGGPKKLTIEAEGAVVLDGVNTYTGGTHVKRGIVVFGNPDAVPQADTFTNKISVAANAYAGYTSPESFNANFLAHFNRSQTYGTIGMDTDPDTLDSNGPSIFSQNINLGGQVPMLNARLGSATAAIYNGDITPADGTNYRFGGGGGLLVVASSLTGTGSVDVTSSAELPLTLRLTGENTYQGGTHAEQSAVVFENAASLPATGPLTMGLGGYVGIAFDPVNGIASDFLARFGSLAPGSIIGFDSPDFYGSHRTIEAALDLSAAKYAGVMLGTTGNVSLNGAITPNASTYRFAAYKGGLLQINSLLTGANSVVIGHPDVQATIGDRNKEEFSRVFLANSANTYTGGTTLHPGHLIVGGSSETPTNALGTGTLTIEGTHIDFGDDDSPGAYLTPGNYGVIIPNAIVLNANLDVGGTDRTAGATLPGALPSPAITLAGNISGTGLLSVGDESQTHLRLSGDNTFSGGIYVRGGSTLALASNTATGTGQLSFGSSGSSVYFETAAPVIGGLHTNGSYVNLQFTAAAPVLTVNQTATGHFEGELRPDGSNTLSFIKTGTGTLYLDRGGIYYGTSNAGSASVPTNSPFSLQVNQGALVVGNSFELADYTSPISVNGGTLVTGFGQRISNPLVVENGGRLAGFGSYTSATIGTGATVAPGFAEMSPIGFLHFDSHLEFAAGGTYEWHVASSSFSSGQNDGIYVGGDNTFDITATAANRFTLKIISLDLAGQAGALTGLSAEMGTYGWMLVASDHMTGSSDFLADPASVFNFDTSEFSAGGLTGTFGLVSTGNSLILTFTPVPEPSTYALMALGLGFIGVTLWRRRRA